MISIAIILLNRPSGFAARFNFFTAALQPYEITERISTNQIVYANIFTTHRAKLAGRIVESISQYVGEQVLNTGPNTAHKAISHRIHFPHVDCCACAVLCSIHVITIIFCQSDGNKKKIPNTTRIIAEINATCSLLIQKLSKRILRIIVKASTDTANEAIITRGRDFFQSITDQPIITGSNGSTHGANTVNIHAKNDTQRIHIDTIS